MKFTVAQLRKLSMPYHFSEDIDLSLELNGLEDIIRIEHCHVDSTIKNRGDGSYRIDFVIDANLILQDSITLEEINYPINTNTSEVFTTDESITDAFLIEGITLDTKEAIISAILCEKPMTISNSDMDLDDNSSDDSEEEEKINPAFASLKDLL